MNLEQFQYTVAGFRALDLYPFTKMAKRYFRGFRQDLPNQLYRIVIYPQQYVKAQPLIQTLKAMKNVNNQILGKITCIMEETTLTKNVEKSQTSNVTAVIFQDDSNGSYVSIYDFIIQMGNISQILSKDCTYKVIQLIKQMRALGFNDCFEINDLLIQKSTGKLKIDVYGDNRHFLSKTQIVSDIWEIGYFVYTMLKGSPPYNNKSTSDPFYSCLKKQNFQKFWQRIPQKPVRNPSYNASRFIESCFSKQTTLQKLFQMEWLQDYQPLSTEMKTQQINSMIARKQQRMCAMITQKRNRAEKINQALHQRSCFHQKRGTYQEIIQTFLQYFLMQEDIKRMVTQHEESEQHTQKQKLKIAEILTILSLNQNQNVQIYDIRDKKQSIFFRIKSEINENIIIDSQVQLQIQNKDNNILFNCKKIDAPFYQSIWINNYIKQLIS